MELFRGGRRVEQYKNMKTIQATGNLAWNELKTKSEYNRREIELNAQYVYLLCLEYVSSDFTQPTLLRGYINKIKN